MLMLISYISDGSLSRFPVWIFEFSYLFMAAKDCFRSRARYFNSIYARSLPSKKLFFLAKKRVCVIKWVLFSLWSFVLANPSWSAGRQLINWHGIIHQSFCFLCVISCDADLTNYPSELLLTPTFSVVWTIGSFTCQSKNL